MKRAAATRSAARAPKRAARASPPATGIRTKVPAEAAAAAAPQDATAAFVRSVLEGGGLPETIPPNICKGYPSAELGLLRDRLQLLAKKAHSATVTKRGEEVAAADPLRDPQKAEKAAFERISSLTLGAPTKYVAEVRRVAQRVNSWVPGETCACEDEWWRCNCAARWEDEHAVDADDFVKDELSRPVHKMVSFAVAQRAKSPVLTTKLLRGLKRALGQTVDLMPLQHEPDVLELFRESLARLADVAADAMRADKACRRCPN